ncbi:MAG TPA: ABC transporter permease [Hyphomonadaceae bacterium]|jgi:putative ABC transport system permease protein|nr:ABC transporter permease [Hyphomonadaceae bacterium]
MFRNYIGPAFARIARAPFTSAANILTLALGLACFIAAFGIATYWQSADSYHAQAGRIFVLGQSNTLKGQAPNPISSTSSVTLAKYLKQDFPEIEHIARATQTPDVAVAAGDTRLLLNQGTVDPDFLSIFDFDFVAGDPRNALAAPNGLVLTQSAAERLFGHTPAMGQRVLVNARTELTVTGVIRPVRQPSFMGDGADAVYKFDMLRSWAGNPVAVDQDTRELWTDLIPFTFLVLSPTTSADAFNAKIPGFFERHIPREIQANAKTIARAFPAPKITTFDLDRRLFGRSGVNTSTVAVLLALAALTLVIACANYANLATAQAAGQSKEIGMRRVLGAGMLRVMAQAWLEAMVLTAIAAVLAIAALGIAAPAIMASTSIDILYFFAGGWTGPALVAGLIVFVAFFAGAYPALILSRVRPAAALRSGKSRSGSRLMTRVLVALQFASAGFLLIMVTITQLQRTHLERAVLGPRESPVVVLNDLVRVGIDYETLANRLEGRPGIERVSVADIPPWSPMFNGVAFAASADPSAAGSIALLKTVGHDYFDAFSLKLLAGRAFNRQQETGPRFLFGGPTAGIVIDHALANSLGFATPQAAVGKTIYVPSSMTGGAALPAQVIGVTDTEAVGLESGNARGVAYQFALRARWGEQRPIVRLAPGDVAKGIASITDAFKAVAPNIPPQIRFYDQQFELSYRQYGRLAQVFIALASAAFIIASIGLLGIAVHVAAKRRHEIAVRKTLGSSAVRVVRLLLTDFSQPVLIGNLIAWPAAWLAAQAYLGVFAERIELSPVPFIISLAITLAIAWGATIGVVLRAATQRPADVLRRA